MIKFWKISAGWGLVLSMALATSVAMSPVQASDDPPQTGAENEIPETEDPFEGINRVTSGFNSIIRGALLDPLVDGYQAVTPEFLQQAISNAASNLSEPATAVSSLLQGDTDNAGKAASRFFINTTLGFGGTQDPATDMGIEQRREDLGQVAGVHGGAAGPHIVLPLLGPSNSRDLMGDILTSLISPLPMVAKIATTGVEYSDNQDEINAATQGALDAYVVEREAYEQHRRFLINNGDQPSPEIPSLDDN